MTEAGLRLPATLSMLLFDSSGVNKDATLTEHREALSTVTSGAVEIKSGRTSDARMIVLAAAASARVRARFDQGLLDLS